MNNQRREKAEIGRRLREIRERARISIAEVADALQVQPLAVEKWEKGSTLPSLLDFKALLPIYGVMACDILFDVNPIQLDDEHSSELRQAEFSPSLRTRVDFLLTLFAKGKEPVWRTTVT